MSNPASWIWVVSSSFLVPTKCHKCPQFDWAVPGGNVLLCLNVLCAMAVSDIKQQLPASTPANYETKPSLGIQETFRKPRSPMEKQLVASVKTLLEISVKWFHNYRTNVLALFELDVFAGCLGKPTSRRTCSILYGTFRFQACICFVYGMTFTRLCHL